MGRILLFCTLFVCQGTGVTIAENCTTATYLDFDNKMPSKEFDASDKVILKLFCTNLPPGQHIAQVHWAKNNYGPVRIDRELFTLKINVDRELYFWFKLDKLGLLNRLTSLSDYNSEMIGNWSVESYLNGKLVGKNQFTMY